MKYFCMFLSNICFDRSYFPISFAVVLIARGKNHYCITKHHEGKSLLTEILEVKIIIPPDCLANLDEMLIHQRFCTECSVQCTEYSVRYSYSIHTLQYSTHTVYCIHTWMVCTNSFLSPPLKLKLDASNLFMIMRSYYTMIIMLKRSIWPHWQSENPWSASG